MIFRKFFSVASRADAIRRFTVSFRQGCLVVGVEPMLSSLNHDYPSSLASSGVVNECSGREFTEKVFQRGCNLKPVLSNRGASFHREEVITEEKHYGV